MNETGVSSEMENSTEKDNFEEEQHQHLIEELTISFAIWTGLVLAVTLVYITLLVQLFRNRKKAPFTHTFFRISLQLGIADVLMIVYSLVWNRLPRFHVFLDTFIDNMSGSVKVIFADRQSVLLYIFCKWKSLASYCCR
jgi:hypothetical protein